MRETSEHLKSQEMCNHAVQMKPCFLAYATDSFKAQDMCERGVEKNLWCLKYVSDHFKTERKCVKKPLKKGYGGVLCP